MRKLYLDFIKKKHCWNMVSVCRSFFLAVCRELGWGFVVGWESIITVTITNNWKYDLSPPPPPFFPFKPGFGNHFHVNKRDNGLRFF